jgi:hypothetical protein
MAVVETEALGQILVVRMNRPERLNALGHETRSRLAEVWTEFRRSSECEVAILTGTGRAFCAGDDMKESLQNNLPGGRRPEREDPFLAGALEKPVIAAVNGYAIGGGFTLVERSDLRVAVKGGGVRGIRGQAPAAGRLQSRAHRQSALSDRDGDGARLPLHGRAPLRARLSQPAGRARSADGECHRDGRASLDAAAGLAGQHRAHDAADAAAAVGGTAASRRPLARARRQERSDRVARRLCRKAGTQIQGLGRPAGPLSPAKARYSGD